MAQELTQAVRSPRPRLSYSSGLRRTCYVAALVVAVLPIPVMLLRLVPAYGVQARFLVVYAPLVCLITLAYLFYVRDSLARLMFAHLLNPLPPPLDYYPERLEIRLQRLWVHGRRVALALLPVLLLVGSVGCALRYLSRLDDSLLLASLTAASGCGRAEDACLVTTDSLSGGVSAPALLQERGSRQRGPVATAALPLATPADIPHFVELSLLYIGSFLAPLVALALMGLREYAREALGLTEEDVVLGRVLAE